MRMTQKIGDSFNRSMTICFLGLLLAAAAFPGPEYHTLRGTYVSPGMAMVIKFEPCSESLRDTCGKFVLSWHGESEFELGYGSNVITELAAGEDGWQGSLIDPSNGRRYRGNIKRIGPDTLELKGCAGLFCRTEVWHSLEHVAARIDTLQDVTSTGEARP